MRSRHNLLFMGILILLTLSRCHTPPVLLRTAETASTCYIVYDAGSSGTRLYIYEQDGAVLREYEGPKVSALADPVREFRGKTWNDAEAVTTAVVAALDDMRKGGPLDDQGQPQWAAFDWTTRCQVASAAIYASAGMRIAEQEHPERSLELWTMVKRKLQAKVGATVKGSTRTLTGFEEGLYAWLAVSQTTKTYDFGMVEMGGLRRKLPFHARTAMGRMMPSNPSHLATKPSRCIVTRFWA
jgi:hypothetical protein